MVFEPAGLERDAPTGIEARGVDGVNDHAAAQRLIGGATSYSRAKVSSIGVSEGIQRVAVEIRREKVAIGAEA
jgi:hypothetical protein